MTIAVRQLSSKIQAARAYAVMNRCYVAVLLPNSSVTEMQESMRASAYRVCVVSEKSDHEFQFEEWIEDENWKTLPSGILRFPSDTADNANEVAISE